MNYNSAGLLQQWVEMFLGKFSGKDLRDSYRSSNRKCKKALPEIDSKDNRTG